MDPGLIVLGLAALASVTVITVKTLDFVKNLKPQDAEPEKEKPPLPDVTLCKNCRHRDKDWLSVPDFDKCLASPAGKPHPVTGKHEKFYYCKDINTEKRCPKFEHR